MVEGINEKLDKIQELLEKKDSGKFKFPKLSGSKKRKGHCIAFVLRTNGWTKAYKLPIEDNVVKVPAISSGDIPTWHEVGADQIFYYKKEPVVFIPEWDMKPISKLELMDKAKKEGTLSFVERYIFTRMRKDLITGKKMNIGSILLVLLVIGGLIIGANYFGLFG